MQSVIYAMLSGFDATSLRISNKRFSTSSSFSVATLVGWNQITDLGLASHHVPIELASSSFSTMVFSRIETDDPAR